MFKHAKKIAALAAIITILTTSLLIFAAAPYYTAGLTGPAVTGDAEKIAVTINIEDISGDGFVGLTIGVKYNPNALTPVPTECGCTNVPQSWYQDFSLDDESSSDDEDGDELGCSNVGYNESEIIIQIFDQAGVPNKITNDSGAYITLTFAVNEDSVGFTEVYISAASATIIKDGKPTSVAGAASTLGIFIGNPRLDINVDEKVNVLDMIKYKGLYTSELGDDDGRYDYNGDGKLDEKDVLFLQKYIIEYEP